jgi:RND family efflux transporter MFP subunit
MRSGPDITDVEVAQAKLNSAEAALEGARAALEGATIVAPLSGVITAVDAQVGETVGSASIISLADLAHPQVEIWVDEVDVHSVAPGYEVEVVFDALPDDVFTGHVIRVEPALATIQNAPTVIAFASLDVSDVSTLPPLGANARVEVTAGRAENALLVPVEALRELGPGQYAVMVVVDGEPQMREVEVGIMDYTYAEIVSGLEEGERVSTGMVPTQ